MSHSLLACSKNSSSRGFDVGLPASIIGMPSSSSTRTISSLSLTEKDMPSPCAPSRRVESRSSIFFKSLPPVSVVYYRVAALKSGYARARKLGYSVGTHVRYKRIYSFRLARKLRREHRVAYILDPRAVGYDGL